MIIQFHNSSRGFTILEVLLVIAVIAILSAAGVSYFRSSIVEVAAGSTMKSFVADIEAARGRAIVGDRGMTWGVRAVPQNMTWEFYATTTRDLSAEVFQTETHMLPFGVSWLDPSSNPKSIEFAPLTGSASTTTFVLGYGTTRLQAVVNENGAVVVTRVES
ncbi:MAG TPA: prepilin-type N-terminal cleavage/methylation domain-containing protein [Candidatus Paceibacterota bacterium]|nr:prepilin-type N-terminal cleavage/methylation domain-containing protein [Candidatus Paceibacterota bacterium]